MTDESPRLRGVAWALAVALVGFAIWREHTLLVRFDRFVHDDTFITLRYARNLLAGDGPVWNPGERVEGYTSVADLLGVAALGGLGLDLLRAARLIDLVGMALLAAAVAHATWTRAAPALRPLAAAIPVALAVSCAPLLVWVQGGLEAPLVTGWVALALAVTLRAMERPADRRAAIGAGLALGAIPLFRPDAAVFLVAGVVAWTAARWRSADGRARDLATFAGCVLALPVVQVGARLAIYGALVPNTVIVKATGLPPGDRWSVGWAYLREFGTEAPWVPLAAMVGGLVLLRWPRWRGAAALLVGGGIAQAGAIVAAGGDHMVAHRLLLPVLAPALLLVGLGAAALTEAPGRWGAGLVGLLGLASVAAIRDQDARYPSLPADAAAYVGAIVGDWLAANYPPGTLVALNTAGSTPYVAADLRFVDMLGLNDAHIARREITAFRTKFQRWPGHGKGDGDYVLGRDPDIVIIGPAEGREVAYPWFLGDLELKEDPRFGERYQMRRVEIPVGHLPDHRAYKGTRGGSLLFTWYERTR